MNVAAIDIGSNSIHMVVARVEADGHFTLLDRAKEIVQLGRTTLRTKQLSPQAIAAGMDALATCKRLAEVRDVERVLAVATSAVREARNGGEFIRQIGKELGLHVDVISGREEARLIHRAVRHALDLRTDTSLLVDIGGGSVELIVSAGETPVVEESLKLGVIRLAERYVRDDPIGPTDIERLDAHVARGMAAMRERLLAHAPRRLIGTSGTILNLVALSLQRDGGGAPTRVHGATVPYRDVLRLRRLLIGSDRAARGRLPGLDRRRVDTIVPGVVLIEQLMRGLDLPELVACDWALREGMLLGFIDEHRDEIEARERVPDPRRRSVLRLATRANGGATHGSHVAALALSLFDQTIERHGLGGREREWLEYGALLHDVGTHVAHARHHRHSHYLIINGELAGFEPFEIEVMAALARYHRKGGPHPGDEELRSVPERLHETIARLAALLRVADGLDRSHAGLVESVEVEDTATRVTVRVRAPGRDAALELWAARRKADLFERVFDVPVALRVEE